MDKLITYIILLCYSAGLIQALTTSSKANKCPTEKMITDIGEIRKALATWNDSQSILYNKLMKAEFRWATNITAENEKYKIALNAKVADSSKELWHASRCFDCETAGCSDEEKRRLNLYNSIGISALPRKQYIDYTYIQTAMEDIYATGKICALDGSKCLKLEPDITHLVATSHDYCKLQWAWHGWRNETGPKMRGFYLSYVLFQNQAAEINGFETAKEMWTKSYWQDDVTFFDQVEQAWVDVQPLYRELHTFVRRKLMEKYSKFVDQFPQTRHIPAHLLGNIWAQTWDNLYPLVVPYPNASDINLTDLLLKNKTSVLDLFQTADRFFQSLGMKPMTENFWKNSVFTRPNDSTEMVCHASAWDLFSTTDFRIKMCTSIDAENFYVVHHEMGHIQYFMQYNSQPMEFRDGANPGFHEAIGDLIALSITTPSYLKSIELLPEDFKEDEETAINDLMKMALKEISFLPFGYLMDKYRWHIFQGDISFSDLNAEWWKLRCKIQGLSPPVDRSEADFDAGSKYHIPASVPYIRYFVAFIAKFQFHRSICQKMGFTKNFHKCNIYNQTAATESLKNVMTLGSAKPYPEQMKLLTDNEKLDSSAILDYFAPLYEWLKNQNKDEAVKGWEDDCPSAIPKSPCGDYKSLQIGDQQQTQQQLKAQTSIATSSHQFIFFYKILMTANFCYLYNY